MKNVAVSRSKQHLEEVVFEDLDVDRLDDHLIDGAALPDFKVIWSEHVDAEDKVAFPMIVKELSIAD